MRIARFNGGRLGVVRNEMVFEVPASIVEPDGESWPPTAVLRLIRDFDRHRHALDQLSGGVPLSSVRLDAPIEWPNKLLAFPVNYTAHGDEMKSKNRADLNGFFLKANSSICGPADAIEMPDIADADVHHECELAVIIGRGGRAISAAKALEHIFGYACLIDVTVRGNQERVMRKSWDTFAPIGPWITTADEIADHADIDLRLWVNGKLRQEANTRDLIVNIPEMIEMASRVATLYPGDVIATGTPAGVGPISVGDSVQIAIEGLGEMTLPVIQSRGRP